MKKPFYLIVTTVFIIAAVAYYKTTLDVPGSFALELQENATSSSGNRQYNASAIFRNGRVVEGTQVYQYAIGAGCTENCEGTHECIVKEGEWVDAATSGSCQVMEHFMPKDSEDLQNRILKGEIHSFNKSFNKCEHYQLCYSLTPLK